MEAVEAAEESAISYRMTLGEESTALEARAAGPGQDRAGQGDNKEPDLPWG